MNLIATKTETHIGKVRSRMVEQIHEVNGLLEWSHEQYCNHQFEEYLLFVEKLSQGYPSVRSQIMYSPIFRGMWNNEWSIRDEYNFIPFAVDCWFDVPAITDEYLWLHSHVRLLQDEAFMNRYAQVMKLIHKDERRSSND